MSPPPIDSHSSAAHAEHSVTVPSCVSLLLHYRVPVNSYSLESVATCMWSLIESRAGMPACSKWGLYDYEAASRSHNGLRGLNNGNLPCSTQSLGS
jgi:hypothetical protein